MQDLAVRVPSEIVALQIHAGSPVSNFVEIVAEDFSVRSNELSGPNQHVFFEIH